MSGLLRKAAMLLLGRMSRIYQRAGVWILPDHFYMPIPEIDIIKKDHQWNMRIGETPGLDLNVDQQLHLLEKEYPKYVKEYDYPMERPVNDRANGFYFNNHMFANTDAEIYYCMVRHLKPRTIIEVGAGRSTQICCDASAKNFENGGVEAKIYVIDPYPNDAIMTPLGTRLERLIRKRVQDVEFDCFEMLEENDILFIDSSHVVKSGGDVNHLYLKVLPRLKPGVVVHIHDICLPYEVPREFVLDQSRFFTEQYLLQAFLIGNRDYEVMWATHFMTRKYRDRIASLFQSSNGGAYEGTSFWIRRKPD